ncbi:ribonuclease P/MRP protein subunit POP5 [Cryptotermes secundus]|uniref:ribonuclease P/MRP protein subunit POP5 n=1 Tax=Cryptotermes secundus TaxID=105785 RepID=UPI000CD7CCDE|nr:ribonuclease P/MRP protein subunit POP5 [Cryptotermes secundus]
MVRFKNRYIVIEVNPTNMKHEAALILKPTSLYFSIIKKVQQLHGDFGVAAVKSGLAAKYCNKWTKVAVVRVRHGAHRLVASCLPLLQYVEKQNVIVRTLHTGATLRQCYRFIQHHQRSYLEKIWSRLKSEDERNMMEAALMDLNCLEALGHIDINTKKAEATENK